MRLAELIADHLRRDHHLIEEAIVLLAKLIADLPQQDHRLIEATVGHHQDRLLRIVEVLLQEVVHLDQVLLGHHQEDNNY